MSEDPICGKCGTDHDGMPEGSLGAMTRCLRAQAEAAGAGHLVDQMDTLQRTLDERRDAILRDEELIPDDDQ